MTHAHTADVLVIGAGPGGYVAAIKAAHLGLKVVIVDSRATLGGTCLNVGCIPSKALLTSSHKYMEAREHLENHGVIIENLRLNLRKMLDRKENVVDELTRGIGYLMNKNNIQVVHGHAQITPHKRVKVTDSFGDVTEYHTKNIIIATGSESASIPGIEIDEERIISSTGALNLTKVPKHLVVIGGGYIGLELGSVWARLGAAVTVVEYFDHLAPTMDREVSQALKKSLEAQGIAFRLNRKVVKIVKKGRDLTLHVHPSDVENVEAPEFINCDVALVAVGRRPYTQGLGLENVAIKTDPRGFIPVDKHYETSCKGIYAIGDVIPGPMLAHKAEKEGIAAAEFIAGKHGHVNYKVIPAVVYTQPEAASVGETEEDLKALDVKYKVGKFPFKANSRAKTVGETTGFVKVLTHTETDRILGVHIIGEMAGTMIAEAAMAMEFRASAEDIARTCHAHPTHSEALKEAAMGAFHKAMHI